MKKTLTITLILSLTGSLIATLLAGCSAKNDVTAYQAVAAEEVQSSLDELNQVAIADSTGGYMDASEEDNAVMIEMAVQDALNGMDNLAMTMEGWQENSRLDDSQRDDLAYQISIVEESLQFSYYMMQSYVHMYSDLAPESFDALVPLRSSVETSLVELTSCRYLLTAEDAPEKLLVSDVMGCLINVDLSTTKLEEGITPWRETVGEQMTARMEAVQAVEPDAFAGSTEEMLEMTRSFLETYEGFAENKLISADELETLGHLCANTTNALTEYGEGDLVNLDYTVEDICNAAALGNFGMMDMLYQTLDHFVP